MHCSECGYKLTEGDVEKDECPNCKCSLSDLTLEEEGGASWMFQEAGLPIFG